MLRTIIDNINFSTNNVDILPEHDWKTSTGAVGLARIKVFNFQIFKNAFVIVVPYDLSLAII